MNTRNKHLLVGGFAFIGLTAVALLFWYQDMRYSLPTPRPVHLVQKPIGEKLTFTELKQYTNKPILLHFFNPQCPCSKFNLEHVKSLVNTYSNKVQFVAIVQSEDSESGIKGFNNTGLEMPYIVDTDGSIADSCGVYATPQAVLLDNQLTLYFRGNYNTSRYCTNKNTEFARVAIEDMLAGKPTAKEIVFSALVTTAYGCQLPKNDTEETLTAKLGLSKF